MATKELKFKQIATGQWEGRQGMTFTVVGLSDDGDVYKFTRDGWNRLPNTTRRDNSKTEESYQSDDPF